MFYLTNLYIYIYISCQSNINAFFDYLSSLKKLDIYGSVKTFKNLTFKISNEILMFEKIPITKTKC